jgi:hypothetical protein
LLVNYQVGSLISDTIQPDRSRQQAVDLVEDFANQDTYRALAANALADEDLASYNLYLNQVISQNPCEDDWETISGLLETLEIQNRTIHQMTSTELQTVQTIADLNSDCQAVSNARAILRQVLHLEYPIVLDFGSLRSTTQPETPVIYSEIQLGHAIPNPSTGIVSIPYNLNHQPRGWIKVVDITGRVVIEQPLVQNQGLVEVDLSSYANGTYVYQITYESQVLATEKLILVK